ncbi:MAG: glycosyltransferase family 4 protein [Solirubrobacterales bacterium]
MSTVSHDNQGMRVKLVDPSAFTPPYDRALAGALAAAGAEVELITSEFLYGPVPEPEGYEVTESFYRRTSARGLQARGRLPLKIVEHLPGMLRLRGQLDGDVTHFQWLTMPMLDSLLIPRKGPKVMTAHYIASPRPRWLELTSAQRTFESMDAVIAHSENGARRLQDLIGLPADRVRVIPHGAFDYLTRLPEEAPLPPELEGAEGPVILFFGLMRPYKGIDTLLEAFAEVKGAELWIVGNPRMEIEALVEQSRRLPGRVRWLPRFIEDSEIPAIMRAADVLALPYRDIEQSGVLYTGLAFGKAMVLSDVGGFGEVARKHQAARLVAPGDPAELAGALIELTDDEEARRLQEVKAAEAAAGPYSWSDIARSTIRLYREVGA